MQSIYFQNIFYVHHDIQQKVREWRNQDFVRENMFTTNIISKEEHNKFLSSLKDRKDKEFFIGFYEDKPFCVVNITQLCQTKYEIGYYLIHKENRGKGFGFIAESFLI